MEPGSYAELSERLGRMRIEIKDAPTPEIYNTMAKEMQLVETRLHKMDANITTHTGNIWAPPKSPADMMQDARNVMLFNADVEQYNKEVGKMNKCKNETRKKAMHAKLQAIGIELNNRRKYLPPTK